MTRIKNLKKKITTAAPFVIVTGGTLAALATIVKFSHDQGQKRTEAYIQYLDKRTEMAENYFDKAIGQLNEHSELD